MLKEFSIVIIPNLPFLHNIKLIGCCNGRVVILVADMQAEETVVMRGLLWYKRLIA